MPAPTISKTTRIARPGDEVAAYLARPGVKERLTPPWAPGHPSSQYIFSTNIEAGGPCACTLIEKMQPQDDDAPGPDLDADEYNHLLAWRHSMIRDDIELTASYGAVRSLRIAIAGGTGLVGSALAAFLETQGHKVAILTRDPATGARDLAALNDADALINLAGSTIATPPWNQPQRDLIWESRVGATRTLVAALAAMKRRPYVFLNASASGYYGTRGNQILDETAARGTGFLADVCAGVEQEASAAEAPDMRVALLRFGIVLTPAGGALAAMLPVFKKNLGAKLGHGRQWLGWISIDDAVGAIYHALLTHTCTGPLNIVAPNPVTNVEFARALAGLLGKRKMPRVPRWLLRLRYGIEYANETMLASTRAEPAKLRDSGFVFRHPTIETALKHLL